MYATLRGMSEAKKEEARKLPYVAAITEGVREVLLEQDNAFVAGEDVGQAGSVFGYYAGLHAEFGGERIIDTPISEKGIIGLGVGASATGCRPIVDLMFMDFIGECMDEIANQMAKMRFMFGGGATLPVTVLTMAGAGMNLAAQRSQSLEAWLAHLPGVKVVMPTNSYDAKGLIIAAARDDNPVFVVLNKASLAMPGEVPEGAYEGPIGTAFGMLLGAMVGVLAGPAAVASGAAVAGSAAAAQAAAGGLALGGATGGLFGAYRPLDGGRRRYDARRCCT